MDSKFSTNIPWGNTLNTWVYIRQKTAREEIKQVLATYLWSLTLDEETELFPASICLKSGATKNHNNKDTALDLPNMLVPSISQFANVFQCRKLDGDYWLTREKYRRDIQCSLFLFPQLEDFSCSNKTVKSQRTVVFLHKNIRRK